METITNSPQETEQLARKIAGKIKPEDVLALYGKLGAGKTTFTKFLVKSLGFEDRVQSPTFIVARVYNKNGPRFSQGQSFGSVPLTRRERSGGFRNQRIL